MPRTKPPRHIANAVKDRGASKRRTKEITDQARPRGKRTPVADTITGQGGSRRKGDAGNRGTHPGGHGGVHADATNRRARREPIPRSEMGSGKRAPRKGDESSAKRPPGIGVKRADKRRGPVRR
jgi:hypothetical protein